MAKSTKSKSYKYKKRTPESVRRRAEQSSSSYDRLFKEDLNGFAPKEGSYQLRILPPGWKEADHYGLEIFVHYGVGPDNSQYLCPDKHKNEFCPICDERRSTDDDDERKELAAKKRVLVWLIDRDHEDRGPQLWGMPWTVDRDISQQACDERTGEVLYIDDPEKGYDISFMKEGSGIKTKYSGLKIVHRPSALSKEDEDMDDWLDYIEDHPLPECLNIFDGKYIERIFAGTSSPTDDEDEEEEEAPKRERHRTDEEEEVDKKPQRRRSRARDEEKQEEVEPEDKEDEDHDEIRSRLKRMRRSRRNEN